ncbi:MAG: hypothetical protein CMO34_03790 [Verrucomicrobia bacterium]|nr:hypothetical protein [Verrucomicrobiota bacterium]|tara:strand:+ start:574 stop:1374 length:801 start_codon:yes stop_codon:yes gene_type:complete
MYRWSFLILLFFLGIQFLNGQATTSVEGFNLKNSSGKADGNWRKYHDNGQLRFEGQFKDGIEYGLFRYYDQEGGLKSTLNYLKEGKAMATHYHKNGNIMATGLLVDRKKDSIWNTYSPSGDILEKGAYISGKKYGNWITYFENGQVSEEMFFENDMEEGPFKVYYPDGSLRQEANYVNGFLEGLATFYDAQGNKILKGKYYRGSRNGRWIYYKERLEVEKVLEYDKGNLLNPMENEDLMEDDTDQYKNNRKDFLEFEDLKKRISYD